MALFGDRADPLTRYTAEAEEAIEQEAREKQEARERAAESQTVSALRARVAKLERDVVERDEAVIAAIDALDAAIARVGPAAEQMMQGKLHGLEAKLFREIATRFGEAIGRINALDPNEVRAKAAAKTAEPFRFAGVEKVEPVTGVTVVADDAVMVELPNRLAFGGSGDLH
jgi:hypothetical protein